MNTLRRAIEIKEATGGWSDPGDGHTGQRGCLVINICRAVRAERGDQPRFSTDPHPDVEANKAIVRDVLIEQHPELMNVNDPNHRGILVEAHTSLPGAELDVIMDKAAVIQEAQV